MKEPLHIRNASAPWLIRVVEGHSRGTSIDLLPFVRRALIDAAACHDFD